MCVQIVVVSAMYIIRVISLPQHYYLVLRGSRSVMDDADETGLVLLLFYRRLPHLAFLALLLHTHNRGLPHIQVSLHITHLITILVDH